MDQGLHGVDDDSGERDVEPDREGVAGKFSVRGKTAGEGEEEGDEDHRQRNDGKKDVREQELPIEGPPGAETVEVSLAVEGEVGEIGDQEDRGEEKGSEHRCSVLLDAAGADEDEAGDQRDGAAGVKHGVEQWE